MANTKYTLALIGAGPASLYSAEVLAKAGHEVLILNRDIKPGGLAEFGIYPTKYKMKNGLRKYFARVLAMENVHYFGNVRVGKNGDIELEQLRSMGVDAIVVAVGAQGTKWLGLPGEDAPGAFHAKDLVYHYNALPPFSEREFPIGQHVCVVGLGNVCLDIVHWMICDRKVTTVTAVARRGPAERAFTDKEFKLVCGALDVEHLRGELDGIGENLAEVGQDLAEQFDFLTRFVDEPLEAPSTTKFRMRFLRSPAGVEVNEDGQVTGLICEKTRLTPPNEQGRVGVKGLGEFETIPCDTVVFAIGDSIEPSLGLPLEPRWKSEFAVVPDAWEAHPDRPRYMVYDPEAGRPMWGTFVVGWARKASDGLVGKARADAVQGCDEILAYLDGQFEVAPQKTAEATDVLARLRDFFSHGDRAIVDYEAIKRLEALEAKEARERGLEEFKFASTREMLERIKP
jgi:ferredoxin/flavodoxin---NADP+ reductase